MKTQFTRLIALSALCLAAVGHYAYSQPAMNVPGVKVANVETEDGPPSYMLVLAGLSAVIFIGLRRRRP